jgi:hypothetical protein
MAKTIINIGDANVDVDLFAAYQKKALEELKTEADLKAEAKEAALDFKETVEATAQTTGLPKGEVAAFFKARFEETQPAKDQKPVGTRIVIDRGELYSVLNSALDD